MLATVLCQNKYTENRAEKKEEKSAIGNICETKELTKGTSFEGLVKKHKNISVYKTQFFVNAEIPSRTGKMVNIRKIYHERIMKITQIVGNNEITMFSYIDNVLSHHFNTYQDEISDLYNKDNDDDDLTPKK